MAVGVEICERIKHTTEPNKPLCIKFELQINRREKRKQQQLVRLIIQQTSNFIHKCILTAVFPLNVQLVNVAEPLLTYTAPPYHMHRKNRP